MCIEICSELTQQHEASIADLGKDVKLGVLAPQLGIDLQGQVPQVLKAAQCQMQSVPVSIENQAPSGERIRSLLVWDRTKGYCKQERKQGY